MQVAVSLSSGLLTRFAPLIQFSVFFGFFAFAAVVFYYVSRSEGATRRRARQVFIVALIIGMAVPTATAVPFPPFGSYTFFSHPADQTATGYSVMVVDESGNELEYSSDATPPGRVAKQARRMVATYTKRERTRTAQFLLESAREHRPSIVDGISLMEWVRYRSYGLLPTPAPPQWTTAELDEYGRFTGIRVYRVEIHTAADGLSIERVNRTLVYEYHEER